MRAAKQNMQYTVYQWNKKALRISLKYFLGKGTHTHAKDQFSLSEIVYHDHCCCLAYRHPLLVLFSTPIITSDILHLTLHTVNAFYT